MTTSFSNSERIINRLRSNGLDRLERLAAALLLADTSPIYLRDGDPVPEGVDPARVIFITRTYVDPPERPEEALPAPTQEAPVIEQRRERLEYPDLGIA